MNKVNASLKKNCVGTVTFFIIETLDALRKKYVYGHKFMHLIFKYLQCDDL